MSTHATYRLWRLPSTWSSAEIICNAVLWVKATPTGKASALRCFFTSVQLFLSAVIRHRFTSLVFWLFSTCLFQRWARCLAGCLQNLGCMLQKQRTWTDRYNTFHLFWNVGPLSSVTMLYLWHVFNNPFQKESCVYAHGFATFVWQFRCACRVADKIHMWFGHCFRTILTGYQCGNYILQALIRKWAPVGIVLGVVILLLWFRRLFWQ